MRKIIWILCLLTLVACSKDEDVYPSIITEFADLNTDEHGTATSFELDNGTIYLISNPVKDLKPDATYRVVCGYVPEGSKASLYTLNGAYFLHDSTEIVKNDPTNVLSAWHSGKYINMQLSPKTQGGTHYWGYAVDSITPRHRHLSLHHSQNSDPTSYTTTIYASLPMDSIQGIDKGDTVTLTINTFKGRKEWKVIY